MYTRAMGKLIAVICFIICGIITGIIASGYFLKLEPFKDTLSIVLLTRILPVVDGVSFVIGLVALLFGREH